jgi:hypothetical protein
MGVHQFVNADFALGGLISPMFSQFQDGFSGDAR